MEVRKYEITLVTGEKYSLVTNEDRSDEEIVSEFLDDLGFAKSIVIKTTVQEAD